VPRRAGKSEAEASGSWSSAEEDEEGGAARDDSAAALGGGLRGSMVLECKTAVQRCQLSDEAGLRQRLGKGRAREPSRGEAAAARRPRPHPAHHQQPPHSSHASPDSLVPPRSPPCARPGPSAEAPGVDLRRPSSRPRSSARRRTPRSGGCCALGRWWHAQPGELSPALVQARHPRAASGSLSSARPGLSLSPVALHPSIARELAPAALPSPRDRH